MLFCLQESYDNPLPKPSQAQVKGVCTGCISSCDCGSINTAVSVTSALQKRFPATGALQVLPLFQTIPFLFSATVCPLCTATQYALCQAAQQRAYWKWVTNSGQASETDYKRLMKEMELFGSAFQGLAIRSRCLDYIKVFSICIYYIFIGLLCIYWWQIFSYTPDI